MASASGCQPTPHWRETISYSKSSGFLVSDPYCNPADQEARRLWDRYETGWEMIDLTTSSALLTTPGTAELVGKETGRAPPPDLPHLHVADESNMAAEMSELEICRCPGNARSKVWEYFSFYQLKEGPKTKGNLDMTKVISRLCRKHVDMFIFLQKNMSRYW